jgi:hypothetical protein
MSTAAIDFPVPEFNGLDVAFGARGDRFLTKEQVGDHYGMNTPMAKVASALFFRGGSLSEHGLRLKKGIDRGKAMAAIQAWLCSFDPKHEIKIGTVAYALDAWCEKDEQS